MTQLQMGWVFPEKGNLHPIYLKSFRIKKEYETGVST